MPKSAKYWVSPARGQSRADITQTIQLSEGSVRNYLSEAISWLHAGIDLRVSSGTPGRLPLEGATPDAMRKAEITRIALALV